ncbi:hypothetical protein ANANG_G00026380 [Anguilla anguilla]|uniref:GPI mannosyltransferase 2 n=1 Tax=Anguilla anguilla TaxID=7936 RepID=A0A9D3SCF6_ANGAN|nr:hypothetical protein ANANG_G00026380 [Anguilla anguilla]
MDVRTVVQFAAFTRVLTLVLQAVFNVLIPDHAADAFSPPRVEEGGALDGVVEALLGGLSRWDAEHFLFIAERGYVFEHNHAFFPLLPLGLRATAGGLFVLSAAALYGLGRAVLRDRRLALLSSLLFFCLTPANVFLAAGYSEALFSALTFAGLGRWRGPRCGPACCSPGHRLPGQRPGEHRFLVYLPLRWGLAQAGGLQGCAGGWAGGCVWWASAYASCSRRLWAASSSRSPSPCSSCTATAPSAPSLLPEEVPPALLALARVKGYRVPDATQPPPPWCHARPPALLLHPGRVLGCGLPALLPAQTDPQLPAGPACGPAGRHGSLDIRRRQPRPVSAPGAVGERLMGAGKPASGFLNPRVFVYVVHAGVLLAFGFFCMHVQVLTRFLASSSPVLYWFSAHLLLHHEPLLQEEQQQEEQQQDELQEEQQEEQQQDELQEEQQQDELQEEQQQEQKQTEQGSFVHLPRVVWGGLSHNPVTHLLLQWRRCSTLSRWLLGYFTSYWLLGLALHCNFLPWT